MNKNCIGIVGGGNMGEAFIKGLHKTYDIFVADSNNQRAAYLKNKYHVTAADINTTVKGSSVLILAVKPQDMPAVLETIKPNISNQLIISIAAGLTTAFFEKALLPKKVAVVRCMPNMPALIGEGITGYCPGKYTSNADLKTSNDILQAIGETVLVKESMIDAITAVSGSGPAYVFLFVEQWMAAARKLGFKQDQAKQLVYKTLLGSAHLLQKSEFDATTLREKVTSKKGTTDAAMKVFFKGNAFEKLMGNALTAAKKRAGELAK